MMAVRSIPAYAGEPPQYPQGVAFAGVYPRVCGGTQASFRQPCAGKGLSPRMRGNRRDLYWRITPVGSIPAYAGEPRFGLAVKAYQPVYPRVCGGTVARCRRSRRSPGLSPRMRGNRGAADAIHAQSGSIPAYAGEPMGGRDRKISRRVYPRVCGGTASLQTGW